MARPRKAEVKKQDMAKEESQIKFVNINEVKEEVIIKEESDADCSEGKTGKTISSMFMVKAQPSTSKEMKDKRMEIEHTMKTKMKLTPNRTLLPLPPKFADLASDSIMKEIEWHSAKNQCDSLTLHLPVAGEAPPTLSQSQTDSCNNPFASPVASSSNPVLQFSADASHYTAPGRVFGSDLETSRKSKKRKKLSTRDRYFRNIQEKEEKEHLERMRYLRWKREMLREKREALKEKKEMLQKEREAVREWAAMTRETEEAMHKILAVTEETNQTTNNVPSVFEETKQALQKVSETVVIVAKAFRAIHALFMIESNCDIVI
ncbi:uncharacterized protein [Panulirus ornatus]|uniref:uncharacterized protein isoform X2 n=1 Tax=Panulirus ornatus TaxID=150431 RepID=UPI003A8C5898